MKNEHVFIYDLSGSKLICHSSQDFAKFSCVIVHSFGNILSQVSPVQGLFSSGLLGSFSSQPKLSFGLRSFQPKLNPMDTDCFSETYYYSNWGPFSLCAQW